mgnify:CR=1 FL=1
MTDVTGLIYTFRESARHLWNTYFLPDAAGHTDWDTRHRFQSIEDGLFELLVLEKLPLKAAPPLADEYPFLTIAIEAVRTPIDISAGEGTGRWDEKPHYAYQGEFKFHLIRLWNWYELGFRDYGYYHVRITDSPKYPHVVGREALVPVSEALKVICEEAI